MRIFSDKKKYIANFPREAWELVRSPFAFPGAGYEGYESRGNNTRGQGLEAKKEKEKKCEDTSLHSRTFTLSMLLFFSEPLAAPSSSFGSIIFAGKR